MAINTFDKLNIPQAEELPYKPRSMPYEDYFGEMELDEEEKKDRIELAEKFEVLLLYFFLLYQEDKGKNYESMISERYETIANEFLGSKRTSAYIKESAEKFAKDIVDTTRKHDGDLWYTSKDRGMTASENESNLIGNYRERVQAVKDGMNMKYWLSQRDLEVRHTHQIADGQEVGIFEPFKVGDSLMMFPKDSSLDADMKEIAGCRCVCKYFKKIK